MLAVCSAGASESTAEEVFSGLCQVWQNGELLAEDTELTFKSKLLQVDLLYAVGRGLDPLRTENPLQSVGRGLDPLRTENPLQSVGRGLDPFRAEDSLDAVGRGLDPLRAEDSLDAVGRGLDPLREKRLEIPRNPRLPFLLVDDQEQQLETAFEIQTAGLMRRMRHSKTEKLVLGISGGADSSMSLLVCCNALDQAGLPPENLIAVSMPGPGSSDNSLKNSAELTNLAGINVRVISIIPALSEHLAISGMMGTLPMSPTKMPRHVSAPRS